MSAIIKQSVDTWLPVFSGFYGTIWESDEERELYNINEDRRDKGLSEVEYDDVEWDYETYERDVVKGVTESVGDKLQADGYIKSYKFQKLSSPREYNFHNDSIHVSFTLTSKNKGKILDYLAANSIQFVTYLKDHYTSYDGFMSRHSNQMSDWFNGESLEHEHKLGAILNFILLNENPEMEGDIYEDLSGNGLGVMGTVKEVA